MYIKRLELENFKSFRGKHAIEFVKGFNAITGPNGAGKSNIVDAIVFVLGPRSPKMVRAENYSDLIFKGAQGAPPADFCRVTLVLDNSEGEIPDMPPEIRITRVVRKKKEGHSTYFYLNGRSVRQYDIDKVFDAAAIPENLYNVIMQGDVMEIVNMTPSERREIIDEVSGIKRFEEDIRRAEERRKSVEEDLRVISGIMEEIRLNLENLKKDREEALRYLSLKKLEKSIEKTILLRRIFSIEALINSVKEKRKEREEQLRETKKRISEIERELGNIRKEIARRSSLELKKKEKELKENYDEIDREIKEIQGEINSLKGRKRKNSEMIERNSKELPELFILLNEAEEEIKKVKKEEERIKYEIEELERRSEELKEKSMKYFSEELNEKRKKLEERAREIIGEKAKIEQILKEISEKVEGYVKLKEELKELEERKKILEEEMKELRQKNQDLRSKLFEINSKGREIGNEIEELEKKREELRERYYKAKGRSDREERVVEEILRASKEGKLKGILGKVEDVISYDEKYSVAIRVAGGSRLKAIICEDDEAAHLAINYLKRKKIGRATFLPLNKMKAGKPGAKAILFSMEKGMLGMIKDVINYDRKYEPAIWYAFSDTLLAEDLKTARKYMGGVRIVTLEGELIEASGAMTGGYSKEIMLDPSSLYSKLKDLEENIRKLREKFNALSSEAERIREEIYSSERETSKKEYELKNLMERIREIKEEMEKAQGIKEKKEEMEKRLKELEQESMEIWKELEEIERKATSEEYLKIMDEREEVERELKRKYMELSSKRSDISALEERKKGILEKIEKLKRENVELEEEIKRIEKEISEKLEAIKKLEDKKRRIGEELRKIEEEKSRSFEEYYNLKIRESELSGELNKLKAVSSALQDEISEMEEEVFRKESELRRLQEDLERYEGVEALKENISLRDLEERLVEVREEIERMGEVNLKAIQEYEELKSRYERYEEKLNKLEEERKEAISLERDLKEKRKKVFMDTFSKVRKNFVRIYEDLSGGGKADLILENEQDPFSGGILIEARPPKKRKMRIEALSGGERSLVALSFLLAVQSVVPAPFYVLDEVDMFLDSVNTEKVGKMLKKKSSGSQFIVISLRKATLKYADKLIGITQVKGRGSSEVFTLSGVLDAEREVEAVS